MMVGGSAIAVGRTAADVLDAAEKGWQTLAGEVVLDLLTLLLTVNPAGFSHQAEMLGNCG